MTGIEALKILEELVDLDNDLSLLDYRNKDRRTTKWDYVCFHEDGNSVCLDGDYTADQLEALAWWIRNHKNVKILRDTGEVRNELGNNSKD